MSAVLSWRTITPSNDPKILHNGTEIAVALCGKNSRFAVYEVRCRSADGFPDRRYEVRDAEAISDADVKAGRRPPVVGKTDDITKLEAWVSRGCPDAA